MIILSMLAFGAFCLWIGLCHGYDMGKVDGICEAWKSWPEPARDRFGRFKRKG